MAIQDTFSIASSVARHGWRSVQKPTREVTVGFGDVVDAINPLNHIPFVSEFTGNDISPVVSMAGSFLLGGPLGLAVSVINAVFEEATGHSMVGSAVRTAFGEDGATATAARAYQRVDASAIANANKHHPQSWTV